MSAVSGAISFASILSECLTSDSVKSKAWLCSQSWRGEHAVSLLQNGESVTACIHKCSNAGLHQVGLQCVRRPGQIEMCRTRRLERSCSGDAVSRIGGVSTAQAGEPSTR